MFQAQGTAVTAAAAAMGEATAEDEAMNELTQALKEFNWRDNVVDRAKRLLYSPEADENVKGVMQLKAMLCIGRDEVYEVAQEVIDAGVIARLVEFLTSENRDLQWPAAFCLTNVAAGSDDQTAVVVAAGAVPQLLAMLYTKDITLRRQAVFCLANIAGSTAAHRVMLTSSPLYIQGLIATAQDLEEEARIVELVGWNFRNVCVLGGPPFHTLAPAVDFMMGQLILGNWKALGLWSVCSRFAMESFCRLVKEPEARAYLLSNNFMQLLVKFMPTLPSGLVCGSSSLNQSTLETLAILLVHDNEDPAHSTKMAIVSSDITQVLIRFASDVEFSAGTTNRDASARHGGTDCDTIVTRELAIVCLACIATPVPGNPLVQNALQDLIRSTQAPILNVVTRPFLPYTSVANVNKDTPGFKECAGYIWVQICEFTSDSDQALIWNFVCTCQLLFDVLEVAVENQKMRERGQEFTHDRFLPNMSQHLIVSVVKCALNLLHKGNSIRQQGNFSENPVIRNFIDCQALDKLNVSFEALGTLPTECVVAVEQLARALREPGVMGVL